MSNALRHLEVLILHSTQQAFRGASSMVSAGLTFMLEK